MRDCGEYTAPSFGDRASDWQQLRDYVGCLRMTSADPSSLALGLKQLHGTPWDACIPTCQYQRVYRNLIDEEAPA